MSLVQRLSQAFILPFNSQAFTVSLAISVWQISHYPSPITF